MKKTLLIAAAALAAGVISSQAQVYSLNIVGYVNQPLQGGGKFNMICNPLQATSDNAEVACAGLTAGDTIYLWDKVKGGFYIYNYLGAGSGLTYNWVDAGNDVIPGAAADTSVPPPNIPPGTGFFLLTATAKKNTWTGTAITTSTNVLQGGNKINMVGSILPVGGVITSTNLNCVLLAGDSVYIWDTVKGGYYIYNYLGAGSGLTYDWVDAGSDVIPGAAADTSVPPPVLSVGQGFFYTTATAANWTQNLVQ